MIVFWNSLAAYLTNRLSPDSKLLGLMPRAQEARESRLNLPKTSLSSKSRLLSAFLPNSLVRLSLTSTMKRSIHFILPEVKMGEKEDLTSFHVSPVREVSCLLHISSNSPPWKAL